jgi:Ca-activated chloride channel homolog
MLVPFAASTFLKRSLSLLALTACFQILTFAQTQLDDIHIAPHAAVASPVIISGGLNAGLHVIREDVNLVLVPVSVIDPLERSVVGLQPDNFRVFEGKKAQKIRHFSREDGPVSVGIILDSSGSMKEKMERVREAVHQFCDAANVNDEFFLITFADSPRVASDFTREPSDIEKELLFTQAKGRTALLDAIDMGLRKMKQAQYARKALLIISDGGDNHSHYSEGRIKSAVKESDVVVYAIGTFDYHVPTEEEFLGPTLLSELAEPSGGRAFTVTNPVELPEVARRIGSELRTQYVLGYSPEDVPHDGKWHKINVKLKLPRNFPFLRVHAKTGYYAAAP